MILAPLVDADRYASLHPLFATAFAWCRNPAHRDLPAGRQDNLGDRLFVLIDVGTTADPATRRFESHRRYIDIQVNLAGGEAMDWIPTAGLRIDEPFRDDNDIAFYVEPRTATRAVVEPGWFTVFWPEDAHKPVLHPYGAPVAFRKLVFKVER